MPEKIRLIVGLGNPGREYENTRHNAGAWFVQALARQHNASWQEERKFHGHLTSLSLAGETVRLLMPDTYMNRSGQSVGAFCHFYKVDPASILVAHDELDLPVGTVRLKKGGGHGGHNGLRDIISSLGNQQDFLRLRIGIGHPGQAGLVVSHVLGKPTADEHTRIEQAIDLAVAHTPDMISGQLERAMQSLHRQPG